MFILFARQQHGLASKVFFSLLQLKRRRGTQSRIFNLSLHTREFNLLLHAREFDLSHMSIPLDTNRTK